jgi:hypothetical protein
VTQIAHYEIEFDAAGALVDVEQEARLAEAAQDGRTTLFVFAHGWNNSPAQARTLFRRFFATVQDALPDPARQTAATVGVLWPSMRWPDEPDPTSPHGGAASMSAPTMGTDEDVHQALQKIFPSDAEKQALNLLWDLLGKRPHDLAALEAFQEQLAVLTAVPDAATATEDYPDEPLLAGDPELLFNAFADLSPEASEGGGAAFGDAWDRVWNGAREAARAASYYAMKKRAGIIGRHGLGPLLGRLSEIDGIRVNQIGHSFGARLVCFSLAGMPSTAIGSASPVKSMLLVQGAFSHFAFASSLSFRKEGGALAGQQRRVDGPIIVTYTQRDLALADFYPRASLIHGQDAAARNNLLYRWGAMGWDGAQEVGATHSVVGPVGASYAFSPGKFLNLDCNMLIKNGPWPFGSHSDIIHAELGSVAAVAAGFDVV